MTGTGDAYQLESFSSPVAFWRVLKGKQSKKEGKWNQKGEKYLYSMKVTIWIVKQILNEVKGV